MSPFVSPVERAGRFWSSVLLASVVLTTGCGGGGSSDPAPLRLVDLFAGARVEGTPPEVEPAPPTEWRFDGGQDHGQDHGWQAGPGVTELRIVDGVLGTSTTSEVPVLHVERTSGLDDPDVLHEVVVRARVSEGQNMAVGFSGGEKLDLDRMIQGTERFGWQLETPLVPGEMQTYTMSASGGRRVVQASSIRHLILRPTDVAGAEIEIESVRLVFRRENLATIAAGVSWQGLDEVYRESLVTRAPERVHFELELPVNALLDLAIGTVEELPTTFRVTVRPSSGGSERVLVERTLTTPHRWQEVQVDLSELAGQSVALTLALDSERDGALGFWGAAAVRPRFAPGGGGRPQGVVFVLLDTLRRDHLDVYGYERETAPHLRRLAEQGVRFEDAIAQGAWTKVSVPSLLSSTYPSANGIYEFADKLPASADTLAESFRAAGYVTWGGSGNGFSGRGSNLHQGMEVLHEQTSIHLPEGQSRSKNARVLVDRLLPWLEDHRDVPFFVFLHPIDPHSPYEPYRPYDTRWGDGAAREAHQEAAEKLRPLIEERTRQGGLPHRVDLEELGLDPDEYLRRELDWYDGSTRAADAEIGRLLERLRELGLEENTLVVFVSDHGEEFLDHGGHFHEENVYGELVNVPLILRWPAALPAGAVVAETVELVDLAPSIVELAGLPVPERMQGDSLLPLLRADAQERWSDRPAVMEWRRRQDQQDLEIVDATGIIVDGYKLVHNYERPEGFPEYELYDHRTDPLDQNDIAAENKEVVERLQGELERWRKWAQANRLPDDAEATEGLDAAELERLRSLGYVQ